MDQKNEFLRQNLICPKSHSVFCRELAHRCRNTALSVERLAWILSGHWERPSDRSYLTYPHAEGTASINLPSPELVAEWQLCGDRLWRVKVAVGAVLENRVAVEAEKHCDEDTVLQWDGVFQLYQAGTRQRFEVWSSRIGGYSKVIVSSRGFTSIMITWRGLTFLNTSRTPYRGWEQSALGQHVKTWLFYQQLEYLVYAVSIFLSDSRLVVRMKVLCEFFHSPLLSKYHSITLLQSNVQHPSGWHWSAPAHGTKCWILTSAVVSHLVFFCPAPEAPSTNAHFFLDLLLSLTLTSVYFTSSEIFDLGSKKECV